MALNPDAPARDDALRLAKAANKRARRQRREALRAQNVALALTAAAREMRLPRRDVRTTEAPAKTTKAAERATKTSSRGEPSNADGSVPTPPLQEPPKVLKNGVTVDLGDRSPSLDLEPHACAAPGAVRGARDITERVPGDDDDDWRDIKLSPHVLSLIHI